MINDVFYTNAGTGEFIMGTPFINNNSFQQVEYLESTGTQYIDTGIDGNNDNLSVGIKYLWTVLPDSGSYRYILGSYISEDHNCTRIVQYGNQGFYSNINTKAGGGSTFTDAGSTNVIYNVAFKRDSLTINGSTKNINNNTKGSENNSNIFVWAKSLDQNRNASNLRIYYLKIYDNNTLVRDFAPCYRKSDNELGLYDIVNNEFYTNQGTGTFLKGDNVNSGAIEHIIINDT